MCTPNCTAIAIGRDSCGKYLKKKNEKYCMFNTHLI